MANCIRLRIGVKGGALVVIWTLSVEGAFPIFSGNLTSKYSVIFIKNCEAYFVKSNHPDAIQINLRVWQTI
jgi:hypothetical protein